MHWKMLLNGLWQAFKWLGKTNRRCLVKFSALSWHSLALSWHFSALAWHVRRCHRVFRHCPCIFQHSTCISWHCPVRRCCFLFILSKICISMLPSKFQLLFQWFESLPLLQKHLQIIKHAFPLFFTPQRAIIISMTVSLKFQVLFWACFLVSKVFVHFHLLYLFFFVCFYNVFCFCSCFEINFFSCVRFVHFLGVILCNCSVLSTSWEITKF